MFEFVWVCEVLIPVLTGMILLLACFVSHQVGYWKGQDDCYEVEHHKELENAESDE